MTTLTGGTDPAAKHFGAKQLLRIVLATAAILLIPFVAMQFTGEVNWTASDFVIMAVLLLATGLLLQLAANRIRSSKSRLLAIGAIGLAFLFVWAELAVGIVGSPFAGS
jgi:peptidoglycan/LPS O-acetylase OafA/YrhL